MTTIAALRDDFSDRALRREAYRRMGNPRGVRVFARPDTLAERLGSFSKRIMVLLCARHFMEEVDACVDQDRRSAQSPRWHLAHVRRVLHALQPEQVHTTTGNDIEAMSYDWWIVACVRLARDIGRPVLDQLTQSWEAYCEEAESSLLGEHFPSQDVVEAARQSYLLVYATLYYVLGADRTQANELAARYGNPYFRLLALRGFAEGVTNCQLKVAREVLEAGGLDLEKLLWFARRDSLSQYPEFITWRSSELRDIRKEWCRKGEGRDALMQLVDLTPAPYRYLLRFNAKSIAVLVDRALAVANEKEPM